MNALVTKALPNEDESQCGPLLPRKHLHVWLHYQMRNTNVDEWLFVDTGSGGGEKKKPLTEPTENWGGFWGANFPMQNCVDPDYLLLKYQGLKSTEERRFDKEPKYSQCQL